MLRAYRAQVLTLLMIVLGTLAVSPVQAATYYEGEKNEVLVIDTPQNDNIYVGGGEIVISADVNGDIIVGGEQVTIDSVVDDNLIVVGGNVLVNGEVKGDILAAGGNIVVNADVAGDVRIVGGQVFINSSSITGDLLAMGGRLSISKDTEVLGDLQTVGGLTSSRSTDNPTDLSSFPELSVAAFKGRHFLATNEDISNVIAGAAAIGLFMALLLTVGEYLAAYAILKVFPVFAQRTMTTMRINAVQSTLVGSMVLILSPFLAVVLAFSIIGIPFLGVLMVLGLIVLMLAWVYYTYFVGRYALMLMGKDRTGRALALLVGFLILLVGGWLLGLIPILGWLVSSLIHFLLTAWAIGAIVINKWQTMTYARSLGAGQVAEEIQVVIVE